MLKEPAFVILAAGKGSRLGGSVPKPLTRLSDGRTILQQQLQNIEVVYGSKALSRTYVVIGYRAEELADVLPRAVKPVYNHAYDSSNTAHSLLQGLKHVPEGVPVIWMNGDVVFSPLIFGRARAFGDESFMAVVPGSCAEEEMKYSLNSEGFIRLVSKENSSGVGEAVGINQISAKDRRSFMSELKKQRPTAYFEAAIQETIRRGSTWSPLDTSGLHALEIDFAEDLERVNRLYGELELAPKE